MEQSWPDAEGQGLSLHGRPEEASRHRPPSQRAGRREGGVQPAVTVRTSWRLEDMFRKRRNPLLYKSFKGGILKMAFFFFLPLLRGERASEETR